MIEERKYRNIKYLIWLPTDFDEKYTYPVVFHTHGAGLRGTDPQVLKNVGMLKEAVEGRADLSDCVIVSPQCFADTWFDIFEQLIAFLRKEKLVISNRGAQGGSRLAAPPEEITVGQVLRALEGGLNLVDCLLEEDSCGKTCACPSRVVWLKIRDGLNSIVDGITLQDMINEYACRVAQGE